jgi:DNA invertase Pin-like site-specific DNA recombinase
MPRIWGSGRASTDKQIITPEAQHGRIKLFVKYQQDIGTWGADWVWVDFFCDSDVSGSVPFRKRPMGNYIFTNVQPGDVIVFADFDRAFRNTIDFLETMELLNQRQVGLIVLDIGKQPLDTTDPAQEAMLTTMAAFKRYEIRNRGKRVKDAMNHLRTTRGVLQGNKLGWKLVKQEGTRGKIAVPDQRARKVGAWIVHQVDVEGWGKRQCWQHLWRNKETRFCLGGKKEISEWHVTTLYKLHKAGWPKNGDSDGMKRNHQSRRPCFATTDS